MNNGFKPRYPQPHWTLLTRTFSLIALFLLCTGLSTGFAANLLMNPGFETGLTDWSAALRGGVATIVTNASEAHSGNAYCSTLTPAGWSSIAQGSSQGGWAGSGVDIPVSSQKFYQLSAWVKVPGASGGAQDVVLRFRFQPSGDRWDVGQQTITDENWHQLVGPWLNPRAGDNLLGYFEVHGLATNGVTLNVDDCSVLESDGCAIAGVVKDNSGNPMEGALVQLKQAGTVLKTTTSLSDGTYTFNVEPVEGGVYDLNASKLNYSSPAADVSVTTVAPPAVATAANLVLTALPMVTVSGVVTSAGQPVAAASVNIASGIDSLSTNTATDGKYSFRVAASVAYTITASRLPLASAPQYIAPTADLTVNFALTSATVVGLYADGLTAGPISIWTNAGTLGGRFELLGATTPVAGAKGQFKAVNFNNNPMVLSNFLTGGFITAPAEITGVAGNYTVSAWLLDPDPVLPDQQTYVSWAKRGGPNGSNCEMVYGINPVFGAAGHWGAPDMSWGTTPPTGGTWHNVMITWNGSVESAYIDGVLALSQTKTLDIAVDLPIVLGSGYDFDSGSMVITPGIPFSGYIAQLEIMSAPATAQDAARLATLSPPMLPIATIKGKVVTSDGSTNAGFSIRVMNPSGATEASTTTGSDGSYSCSVAAPGTYAVKATKLGYVTMPAPQTNSVLVGDTKTLADFTATPSTITGVLKDSVTGNPIYNGVVQTGDPTGPAVVTAADGAFTLPALGCGGVDVYADAVNYAGRLLLVTGTGNVPKNIALTAGVEPASYNGNMEDLVNPQPAQWAFVPWGTVGSIDWSASPTAKTGTQSLFYCPTDSPVEYDGINKVIPLTPGYNYNFYFSAKADPEVLRWQPLVEFMDATGGNWDGFVSADPSYYEYAHTPPYNWHTYFNWFDRSGTRTGSPVRWTPLPNQTECHFIFLYEASAGVLPPAGKGCYIDDLVLDAVPNNMVVETVGPDSTTPPAPTITSVTFPPGGVPTFKFISASSAYQYRMVYRNSLATGSWTPVNGTWTLGNGSELTLTDPTPGADAQRFYRVETQAKP